MVDVTVITCTGGRPEAFALCERWMGRQTVQGFQWVVIDDCDPATKCTMGQDVVRPEPRWRPGEVTLGRNILAGLETIRHSAVVFIEDDDWYGATYLETMAAELASSALVGQAPTRYYNIAARLYRDMGNSTPSLCQTALRDEKIEVLKEICRHGARSIDRALYTDTQARIIRGTEVVGMKGMPGRPGIGVGHRPKSHWLPDEDGSVLRQWIGDDAQFYAQGRLAIAV